MRNLFFCWLAGAGILFAFIKPGHITIKGKIVDESTGDPLPAAVVHLDRSKTGASSASDGYFTLTVNHLPVTLIINAIGYEAKRVEITDSTKELLIRLKPSSTALQEVIVTGAGRSKRREFSGSVATISPRQFNHSGAPGDQSAIISRTPVMSGRQDRKDDKVTIRMRGISTSKKNKAETLADSLSPEEEFNTEDYDGIVENRFLEPALNPLSTFSIDVDGAAYANVRRFLSQGQLPPAGAVRIEELINYFHYGYPQPKNEDPFSINTEISSCPWNPNHRLVMVGLQGKEIHTEKLPPSNLVFLIDVSGSMMEPDKLPLVQSSMKLLVDQLREQDKVALVAYAGNAGLVLGSTPGSRKEEIKAAIDRLEAGGSTAGGAGIGLAYKTAVQNFIKGGNNRVILCTDGDFNVGPSSDDDLERLIEDKRETGVYLTVLGFGMGNYKDNKMQKLADKGNGNHAYIDNFSEAKKVLVNEFGGTLFTIAKDVKLQVEFNPGKVQAYRLIGYENRILNKEDFNNDQKDAGDLGSGHTVTALYEIIPQGINDSFVEPVDKLKYQNLPVPQENGYELMTIKFRYKKPGEELSKLIVHPVIDEHLALDKTSDNFRFVSSVAEFGMLLRNSGFRQKSSYDNAWKLAKSALGKDVEGYRSEYLRLLKNAGSLSKSIKQVEEDDVLVVQ